MAISRTDKVYTGTLTAASVTIDTIAANTTFIMQGFAISNANAADKKAELLIDNKRFLPYVKPIPTGDALVKSGMNYPITTGLTIKLKGEVAADMDFFIWGVNEVTS